MPHQQAPAVTPAGRPGGPAVRAAGTLLRVRPPSPDWGMRPISSSEDENQSDFLPEPLHWGHL